MTVFKVQSSDGRRSRYLVDLGRCMPSILPSFGAPPPFLSFEVGYILTPQNNLDEIAFAVERRVLLIFLTEVNVQLRFKDKLHSKIER